MKEKFLKDLGIYGVSTLLVRLINFILIPVFARVLGPVSYGVLDLINVLTYITSVFVFLEMYQSVARFYNDGNSVEQKQIVSTGLWHYLYAIILLLIIVFLFQEELSVWLTESPDDKGIVYLAFVAAACMSLFNYLQTIQRFALQSTGYAMANVACVLSTVLVSIALVVYYDQGLKGVFIGQIAGAVVGIAFGIRKHIHELHGLPDRALWIKMLAFSSPLTISAVLLYLMNYIDRMMIKEILGLSSVGMYAVIFRIAAVPMLAMNIIGNSLLPHIYRDYKESKKVAEFGEIYHFIWLGGLLLIGWMAWLSPEIIRIMAGSQYSENTYLFPVMLISGFLLHYSYLFVGLFLDHKTRMNAYLYLLGLVFVFAINLCLLPVYGLAGSAIGSFCTALLILVTQFYFSQKAFYFPISIKTLVSQGLLVMIPLLLLFYWGYQHKSLDLLFRLVMASLITIVLLYFSRKSWLGLIKARQQ